MPRTPRGIAEKSPIKPEIKPAAHEIIYIVCPCCGRSRVLESAKAESKGKSRRLRWDFFDPETSRVVQVRTGGGKVASNLEEMRFKGRGSGHGSGFHTKAGLTLKEADNSEKFKDQVEAIKEQVGRLQRFIL